MFLIQKLIFCNLSDIKLPSWVNVNFFFTMCLTNLFINGNCVRNIHFSVYAQDSSRFKIIKEYAQCHMVLSGVFLIKLVFQNKDEIKVRNSSGSGRNLCILIWLHYSVWLKTWYTINITATISLNWTSDKDYHFFLKLNWPRSFVKAREMW